MTMYTQTLATHKKNHLFRERLIIDEKDIAVVSMQNKNFLNFTSNDYLNLASHAEVKKAFMRGIEQYGFGSGSSPLISGFTKAHAELENAFCEFLNCERAIFFNSGYHANIGILTALASRKDVIVADKHCHASLIDGIRLSRAQFFRYPHHDIVHAEYLLKKMPPDKHKILITESVFGMEGTISNISALAAIAQRYNALFIVDDAHGVGVLGKQGRGIMEHAGLVQHNIACLSIPLGKAFGGFGAIVAGQNHIIEMLQQFSRTYCYSTALPPAIAVAALAALKLMSDNVRREQLQHHIRFFIKEAKKRNIPLLAEDLTPIKCIVLHDNKKVLNVQKVLFDANILVSCIRPPTVAVGEARIKISLNVAHSETEMCHLLDLLAYALQ